MLQPKAIQKRVYLIVHFIEAQARKQTIRQKKPVNYEILNIITTFTILNIKAVPLFVFMRNQHATEERDPYLMD